MSNPFSVGQSAVGGGDTIGAASSANVVTPSGYPFTFTDTGLPLPNGSYADIQAVQLLFTSYRIENDDQVNVRQVHEALIYVSREIDAVLLRAGLVVPPPAGAAILPILQQTAAYGAAAIIEHARFESGDEDIGKRASAMQTTYDAMLGLLERQEINGLLMGMHSAGWAVQADRRKYYRSGNLESLPDGTPKKPQFTMQMDW